MLGYLSLDIICSSKLTVFPEFRSLKTVRFSEQIFVRGHYLFREANSFQRAKLRENCELRRTDNVQGQISEHIFCAKWRLWFIYLYLLQEAVHWRNRKTTWRSFREHLSVFKKDDKKSTLKVHMTRNFLLA